MKKYYWEYTRVNDKLMKGRINGDSIETRELNWWERVLCFFRRWKINNELYYK